MRKPRYIVQAISFNGSQSSFDADTLRGARAEARSIVADNPKLVQEVWVWTRREYETGNYGDPLFTVRNKEVQ